MKTKEDYLKEMQHRSTNREKIEEIKKALFSKESDFNEIPNLIITLFSSSNTYINFMAEVLCRVDDIDNRLKKIEDFLREGL